MNSSKPIFQQLSNVIHTSIHHNKTSYFPNSTKLIQAFQYYVYFKYAGNVQLQNAVTYFLEQINSGITSFDQLQPHQIKQFILVLYTVIESFENIKVIRDSDLKPVQLKFLQLPLFQQKENINKKKQKQFYSLGKKIYHQEEKQLQKGNLFIHEEQLLKLLIQKGLRKQQKNNSSLITPQMIFNFVQLEEDKMSLVINHK